MLPKTVTTWREGYNWSRFRRDLIAGGTVAVVALPLSMAIAIASGVSPERGLYAAIFGGFVISALGGSRYQIGGPAGAFIVLVAHVVTTEGLSGLLLVTLLAGILMILGGLLRLGRLVRLVPPSVIAGFSVAIALIIAASQWPEFVGSSEGRLFHVSTLVMGVGTLLVITGIRYASPNAPSLLIGVGLATWASQLDGVGSETIAHRFGEISRQIPVPHLPEFTVERVWQLLPLAFAFALLGAIESLLSAVVADDMSGRQHRPDSELVAQGAANVVTSAFGGLVVTGTIARTATNVRAGATSPVAGIAHSVFLLVMLLVAAPLVGAIPLAALAAVLMSVAWHMLDYAKVKALYDEGAVHLVVFGLTLACTLWFDLLVGIGVGVLAHVVWFRVLPQLR